jgi:hypothetical protein
LSGRVRCLDGMPLQHSHSPPKPKRQTAPAAPKTPSVQDSGLRAFGHKWRRVNLDGGGYALCTRRPRTRPDQHALRAWSRKSNKPLAGVFIAQAAMRTIAQPPWLRCSDLAPLAPASRRFSLSRSPALRQRPRPAPGVGAWRGCGGPFWGLGR